MNDSSDILLLDASGLHCPLPVLKAKKALRAMASGDKLEVVSTDAASLRDFAAFTRKHGHRLLSQSQSAGAFRFLIEKGVSIMAAAQSRAAS